MSFKIVPMLLFLALCLPRGKPASDSSVELETLRVTFETGAHEISGAALMGGKLYVVADGPEDHSIYEVEDSGTRFALRLAVDLQSIPGYRHHLTGDAQSAITVKYPVDFEGLGACGRDFYIANERAREILRIKDGSSFERLSIDFSGYSDLQSGGANAGFEGVAIDCDRNMLYVAKERSPRVIFVVRMSDWKVVATHDITSEEEPTQERGGSDNDRSAVAPDFSDLVFDHGYLYVVERSRGTIAKLEPNSMRVEGRVSYAKTEHDLYASDQRFGQGEALVLTSGEIILGFDNNLSPLSAASERKYGISGNPPAIIYFRRPAGF